MATIESITNKVKIAFDTSEPKAGEVFEKSAKYLAMEDAVVEAINHDSNKESKQMASMPVPTAFNFLLAHVLSQLRDPDFGAKGGWHLDEAEKSKALDKPAPSTPIATVAGDFYSKLGVPRNASKEEIDQAYRNWAKENHPDVLRSKNADPADIAKAEENAILIGEAYNTLKSPRFKSDYDKFWDENFAGITGSKTQIKKDVPLLGESDETNSPYIAMSFSPSTDKKSSKEAFTQTQSFQQVVIEQGAGGVNPFFISELKLAGLLPEGFSESQLTNAVHLYSRGIKSEDLLTATENTSFLSENEVGELNRTALFMEYMEVSETFGVPGSNVIGEATGQPSFLITQSENSVGPSQNTVSFKRSEGGGLSFMFDEAGGFIKDKAGGFIKKEGEKMAAKTAVGKAIKEGGKKVLKEGSKVLAKTGIKLAGKATLSAFFESLNAMAPGLGTALDVLINYIGPLLISAIKGFFKALSDPESLAKILAVLMIGFAGFGMMGFAGVTGGLGALSYLRGRGGGNLTRGISGTFSSIGIAAGVALTAVVASLAWPIIIALVVIPLSVAMVLFIITSGAYVVPPSIINTPGQIENPYIKVEKVGQSQTPPQGPSYSLKYANADLKPLNVIYKITITAKRGPLTNVHITYECHAKNDAGEIPCPNVIGTIPDSPPGGTVSPVQPYIFIYEHSYNSPTFMDASIVDTIHVTADAADKPGISGTAFASVCIGDCPEDCPSIWPAVPEGGDNGTLYIKQGPEGWDTHSRVEAIDMSTTTGHSIYATHEGIINKIELSTSSPYGTYVDVLGNCAGREFVSRYAHLSDVYAGISEGQHVQQNVVVGLSGSTGTGAPHLHYEFRNCTPVGCAYTKGNGGQAPWMEFSYLPKDMGGRFRGCASGICGTAP